MSILGPTEQELAVVAHLARAWNDFLKLPPVNPVGVNDELNDFRSGVHSLQRLVLARPAYRTVNTTMTENDHEQA